MPAELPLAVRPGNARLRADADRIRFRHALSLLVMTVFVPGSAQLARGNRRVGLLALRTFVVVVVALLGLAAATWVDRGVGLRLATDPALLLALRVGLLVGMAGWVLLLLDAWRLGSPPTLPRRTRLVLAGAGTALTGLVAFSLLFSAHVVAVQRDVLLEVFGDGTAVDADSGRYNVLLLGGDSAATRWGLRPDSVTLASIDVDTGRTVLFGLPRNLANVPFPDGSVLDEQFPDGFNCTGCYLNAVYTWAQDNAELFPGDDEPGLTATTLAVEEITGLPVHYYAMVNMQGFQDLVDAVGGVTVRVRTTVAIGGGVGPITGTIEPGVHHLDGHETLWYARSREYDDDYSRMARQKCVLVAMLDQLSPRRVLLNVQDIARAGAELLSTDIPHSELDTFVELALEARNQPIRTVSFVPPMVDTGAPDYALVRREVAEAVAKAEAAAPPAETIPRRSDRTNEAVRAANSSDDLGAAC